MRSTSAESQGWLAALTDRYKLVFSPRDVPWLIDLEKDPDELTNFFMKPENRETIRHLAKELRAYGEKYKDPFISGSRIKADLDWAIDGEGAYSIPAPVDPPKKKRKKK